MVTYQARRWATETHVDEDPLTLTLSRRERGKKTAVTINLTAY